MAAAEEEFEVNFRLDADGRTTLNLDADSTNELNYDTRSIGTQFVTTTITTDDNASTVASVEIDDSLYDELLFDCEIADSGLMPRTFWVSSDMPPRCSLEQVALDIFHHHTAAAGLSFDKATSGAEWWVQIRPSPQAGRYSMHASSSSDKQKKVDDDEQCNNGISFHWDKDEDLRIMCGGSTYVHPHLSTVTYLTALGAPTLVAQDVRVHNLTGEWIVPKTAQGAASCFISWPATGKHLCFDGRFLHAAPSDLQEPGAWAGQCRRVPDTAPANSNKDADQKKQERRHRRCTFLVNIWLDYKPFNCHPFPETMIDKLSGYSNNSSSNKYNKTCTSQRVRLSFDKDKNESSKSNVKKVTLLSDRTVQLEKSCQQEKDQARQEGENNGEDENVQQLTWPMGGCDSGESIQITIPLRRVREQAKTGGNVRVCWPEQVTPEESRVVTDESVGMFLIKKEQQQQQQSQETSQGDKKRPRLEQTTTEP